MGLLDSAMQSDAEFTADTDQWSESFSYTPKGAAAVTVRGIVSRIDIRADESASGVATREFEVWIPYSSSYGRTTKPAPGDTVAIKDDPSDAGTVTKSYHRIITADSGGWLVSFV